MKIKLSILIVSFCLVAILIPLAGNNAARAIQVADAPATQSESESGAAADQNPRTQDDASAENSDDRPEVERKFVFNYGATVEGLKPGAVARVWFPVAQSNDQQEIESVSTTTPAELQQNADAKYGNRIGYFEATAGESGSFSFDVNYRVHRKEAVASGSEDSLTDQQKELFLQANSLVPVDGRPVELIADQDLPDESLAAGAALYEVVEQHMKYDKSQPGYGNGDSVWACDSKTGNCTDFHSLFISLARSEQIPARFEIGFPLPADQTSGAIGGYHCWAWFHSESAGWTPVDISEADKHPEMKEYYFGRLTADRISMSTGRDIELVPAPAGEPLNYFVYPYIEVDGEVLSMGNIKPEFSFENIADEPAESKETDKENSAGR